MSAAKLFAPAGTFAVWAVVVAVFGSSDTTRVVFLSLVAVALWVAEVERRRVRRG